MRRHRHRSRRHHRSRVPVVQLVLPAGAGADRDGKPQWAPSRSRAANAKDGKHSPPYDSVDTSCFGSSVDYGGRDYFYGSSTPKKVTESSTDYKGNKKDPAADSHGDWWQGSFYY
ncbi:hypothetical protein ZEAMMB73_Zm00001d012383 [Zea mays]|uniref:Uncharacterized protein n=1 Tax=Zea mays TaxID=4577 RepID=K7V7F3_MAIZE|nr:hypothetical protein ZEAMMB73_Zm00001d012383 [Zea mays]